MLKEDIQAAIEHSQESESVDYKASFDSGSPADWLEIIKDIVAFANSGGGVVVFGVADDGHLTGFDTTALAQIDPADLTNKISKYTGQQFAGFEFLTIAKETQSLFAILVSGGTNLVAFSKPGTYDVGGGKQKNAFSAGTVYFRHGAKSELGNSDDLRLFVERRIEEIRKSWLDGIVKVIESPVGSHVQIVTSAPTGEELPASVRLVNDSSAAPYYQVPIDDTHPFRQKEVVEEVNRALKGAKIIKPFQVMCVRRAHHIDQQPTLCYKQKYASARYSPAFVDWLIEQYNADPSFFEQAKLAVDQMKRAVGSEPTEGGSTVTEIIKSNYKICSGYGHGAD